MECAYCGDEIRTFEILVENGRHYCDIRCAKADDAKNPTILNLQKHEEIKQKAWECFLQTCYYNNDKEAFLFGLLPDAWEQAEDFVNFTKEKERQDA